jgi:hypothetical protein
MTPGSVPPRGITGAGGLPPNSTATGDSWGSTAGSDVDVGASVGCGSVVVGAVVVTVVEDDAAGIDVVVTVEDGAESTGTVVGVARPPPEQPTTKRASPRAAQRRGEAAPSSVTPEIVAVSRALRVPPPQFRGCRGRGVGGW